MNYVGSWDDWVKNEGPIEYPVANANADAAAADTVDSADATTTPSPGTEPEKK